MEPVDSSDTTPVKALRPAFGSGEDWNTDTLDAILQTFAVAPGLRVGRGLERFGGCDYRCSWWLRPAFGSGEDWNM